MDFLNSLSNRKIIGVLFFYVFILLLFCSHMSPMYYTNEWSDVNIYFNIAKAMLHGKVLYTEVFDHKGPFIFFIYALGYLISPTSFFGMFIIELAGWFAMVYFVYLTARFYLGKAGACFVAMILPALLIKIMKAGGSAEEFILIFECISFYFFIQYYNDENASVHKPKIMLVHGTMCSMVFFIKMNLMLIWFFPLAGIFITLLLKKEFKNLIANLLMYLLGFAIIAIPVCTYLYVNGALEEAYAIYFELNRKYAELRDFKDTLILLMWHTLYLYLEPLTMAFLALVGTFYFPFSYIKNKVGKWMLMLSGLTGLIIVYISPVYQFYYPLPLLLFSIWGVLGLFAYVNKFAKFESLSLKFVIIIGVAIMYTGFNHKEFSQLKIAGNLVSNPGIMMQKSQRIIMQEKDPTLLNLNFNLGNGLFTTCNIVPSVRYFVTPNLRHSVYPQMRDAQEGYIRNKEVQFVLVAIPTMDKYTSLLRPRDKAYISNYEYFNSLPEFQQNYSLVATDTVINMIDEYGYDLYALYKRND